MKKTLVILAAVLAADIPVCHAAAVRDGLGHLQERHRFARQHVPTVPEDTLTICIMGDVMLHSAQIENCHARYASANPEADSMKSGHYDFSPCLGEIRHLLESADLSIANMEFTLAGPPYSGYPAFCAPDSYAEYVADCGVDVFLTANNHILDKGASGAMRTLEIYDTMKDRGILNTGCFADSTSMADGYPLIVDVKGVKIALVNFTYGTNVSIQDRYPAVCGMDREEIAAAMKKARENSDIIIALPHWGIEYALEHSENQAEMAEFLVRRGADAIIGSHPHVVQDTDTIKALDGTPVPVVYSLGNIISNMSAANTQEGLVVILPVIRYSDGSAKAGTPEYTFTWCSLPGKLTDCHVTIPIRRFMDRKDEWMDPSDHDKMLSTYRRILKTSGIKDK